LIKYATRKKIIDIQGSRICLANPPAGYQAGDFGEPKTMEAADYWPMPINPAGG
jgi:hypothetical protein